MKETTYVRACDLRQGDIIAPDMRVCVVRVGAERVEVVVQSNEGPEMTGHCGPEAWIQLVQEGP